MSDEIDKIRVCFECPDFERKYAALGTCKFKVLAPREVNAHQVCYYDLPPMDTLSDNKGQLARSVNPRD